MQRASIHTILREGKKKQEIRVFPHQPEELAGISVSLSFPTGSVFRHHHALEDPQTPPLYTEYRNWCLSRSGHDHPQQSSCNLSFTLVKLKTSPISKNILSYFTKHLRKGEEGV